MKFMTQTPLVQDLLEAARDILPALSNDERAKLQKALAPFEHFGVAVLWAPDDADPNRDLGLTLEEKIEVVSTFIDNYEVPEGDWIEINRISKDVLASRQK